MMMMHTYDDDELLDDLFPKTLCVLLCMYQTQNAPECFSEHQNFLGEFPDPSSVTVYSAFSTEGSGTKQY